MTVEIEDSGIVKVVLKAGSDIGLDVAIPVNEWLIEHFQERKRYVLTIFEFGVTIDPEAREYGSSEKRAGLTAADAVVVKTLAHKIIVNFYLKYNKPSHPTRAFSSEEKARKWLVNLLKSDASKET
jgi:hypothetical protein